MIAVAIDGPAGAGKSTIARRVAKELGYIYVDTGALYRAIGLFAQENSADPKAAEQVIPLLETIQVSLEFTDGEQRVILCGRDVSPDIRTAEVSMAASAVSAIPAVRSFLFDLQRNLAKTNNVVMDGRDIGTVVLPGAQVKIFLTASPEERARRRFLEMQEKGMEADFESVLADLKERDYNDSHRAIAPLVPAEDSVLADTTGISLEQSVELLLSIVRAKL